MERPGSGFDWSYTHNSFFKLSKTVLMNFSRSYRDPIPGGLSLDKLNLNGSVTTSIMAPISSYKYLVVIFNPKLCWSLQLTKVLTIATFWSSRIWCLSKSASSMSTPGIKQLYNTVAIPRFTYGMGVWYMYLHKPINLGKMCGSVGITNKLCLVQQKVAKVITGRLSTTVGDIMDIHSYILPIDLVFFRLLFWASLQICSLPKSHPLHALVQKESRHKAK